MAAVGTIGSGVNQWGVEQGAVRFRVLAKVTVQEVAYKRSAVQNIGVGAQIGICAAKPTSMTPTWMAKASVPQADNAVAIWRYRMDVPVTLDPGIDYWYVNNLAAHGSVWDAPNKYGLEAVYDPAYYGATYANVYSDVNRTFYFEFVETSMGTDVLGEVARIDLASRAGTVTVNEPVATLVDADPAVIQVASPAGTVGTGFGIAGVPARVDVSAPAGEVYAPVIDRSGNVLQLSLPAGTSVARQPGQLYVTVSNGAANGNVYFFIDAATTFFASGVLDSTGALGIYLPISDLTVGSHTMKAGQTTAPPTQPSVTFTVESAQPADPVVTPVVPPQPPGQVGVNKWVFQAYDFSDRNSVETYTFAVNPDSVKQGFGEFSVNTEATVVSNGQVIAWEGSQQPVEWTWSGRVLDEAQYRAMERWGTTRQRVYVTDHFLRRFLVKIERVRMSPVRDRTRPWHHTYEMTASVLSGEGISR